MAILINILSAIQSDATNVSATELPSISSNINTTNFSPNSDEWRLPSKLRQRKIERRLMTNDSHIHRELFKGNEGSRRRNRYENANFLNVPNSQPPLPSDWEVHPTYPVHNNIPYFLAFLWEKRFQRQIEEEEEERRNKSKATLSYPHRKVSRDLKLALKKAKGAKPILQDIEHEIRTYIQNSKNNDLSKNSVTHSQSEEEADSEDEDIVFIGRDKEGRGIITMLDDRDNEKTGERRRQNIESLVFDGKICHRGEQEGRFVRWLIHEAAEYYGLESRSEDTDEDRGREGDRSARKIIVSFRNEYQRDTTTVFDKSMEMPPPLWCLI